MTASSLCNVFGVTGCRDPTVIIAERGVSYNVVWEKSMKCKDEPYDKEITYLNIWCSLFNVREREKDTYTQKETGRETERSIFHC